MFTLCAYRTFSLPYRKRTSGWIYLLPSFVSKQSRLTDNIRLKISHSRGHSPRHRVVGVSSILSYEPKQFTQQSRECGHGMFSCARQIMSKMKLEKKVKLL